MSLATLDELFGPLPPENEHFERFGYREENLNGERYYVGRSDKGFAITMRRHRAKGLFNKGWRKKKKTTLPIQERTMKIVINPEALERANAAVRNMQASIRASNLRPALESAETVTLPPTPQEKPIVFARVASWLSDKWYDEEWHKGARNTAGTIIMWAFTVFALVTFGKGMLWLLML